MDVLTQVTPEFHMLPFHLWDTDEAVDNYFKDSARELLWQKHFIYIDQHCYYSPEVPSKLLSDNVVLLSNQFQLEYYG